MMKTATHNLNSVSPDNGPSLGQCTRGAKRVKEPVTKVHKLGMI